MNLSLRDLSKLLQGNPDLQVDAPNEPGWWAFEGYINYAKPPVPNGIIQEVVRVYWGRTTNQLFVERVKGIHPASMLIGKWYRLYTPWEARLQGGINRD